MTAPVPVTPAQRGELVLSDTVIEKIAAQAASEVSNAGGRSGGFLGIGASTDFSARPSVDVELTGRTAALAVKVGVAYPTPIRAATSAVRDHVVRRVEELSGVEVRRVDITVAWLSRQDPTGPDRATPSSAHSHRRLL